MSAPDHSPDISVVVPTYNRADLLDRAIASVLAQSIPVREILVVDDGSTDGTAALAGTWPAVVRYIRQANGGVAVARNTGIAAARGEWIALLDSDDQWAPEKLAAQMAALAARPECRWSCSGCVLIDATDAPRAGPQSFAGAFPLFRERHVSPEAFFGGALERLPVSAGGREYEAHAGDFYDLLFAGNVVLPSSAIVHRELFDRVGVFDPAFRLAEETEFFHRVASAAPGVVVMAPLVRYRVAQAGSLTASTNTPALVRNALRSIDGAVALRTPRAPATTRAWRAGRQSLLLRLSYAELSAYHGGAARAAAWQAISGGPPSLRAAALLAAGFLPTPILRTLHATKRRLQGGAAS